MVNVTKLLGLAAALLRPIGGLLQAPIQRRFSFSVASSAGESDPLPTTEPANSLAANKAKLLRSALVTGRGSWANDAEKLRMTQLVNSIEEDTMKLKLDHGNNENKSNNSHDDDDEAYAAVVDGTWELILSDLEPFRASIFFLALASRVEADIRKGASAPALSVHRLATSVSEVERVAWRIETNYNGADGTSKVIKSLVQLKLGSVPSLPVSLDGVVVSTGSMVETSVDYSAKQEQQQRRNQWLVTLSETSVQRNQLLYGLPQESGLTPFANDSLLKFISKEFAPSGDIFRNVLSKEPTAVIDLNIIDDEMLIAHVPELDQDNYFVFIRSDRQVDPWKDVLDEMDEQEGQRSQSLLGSVAALGMLNPFFSRRARGEI